MQYYLIDYQSSHAVPDRFASVSIRFYLMKENGDSNVIDVSAAIFDLRATFPQLLWCISIVHESYEAFNDIFMVLFGP